MFLDSTRAVADKLLRDVRRVTFGISLAVQILFLAYYGWSIYNSIDSLPFLIIYSCLALVAIVSFINFLVVHKKKEKKNKVFNRILRIAKYIINGVTLGLNAYQLFTATAHTDLQIILLGISGIFWLVNIVVEILRAAVEYYFQLFEAAIRTDFAVVENTVNKVKELSEVVEKSKEVKGNFFEFIDKPLEAIANKITNKPPKKPTVQTEVAPTAAEKTVQQLTEQLKEDKKEQKKQKRAARKQRSHERAQEEKQQIKEHWQTIVNAVKEKMKRKKKK